MLPPYKQFQVIDLVIAPVVVFVVNVLSLRHLSVVILPHRSVQQVAFALKIVSAEVE